MATGETKLSYLDVVDDIQDGDTVPILRNGKNYMSTGLAQVSADLTDITNGAGGLNIITASGSLFDFADSNCSASGAYFLTALSSVVDLPESASFMILLIRTSIARATMLAFRAGSNYDTYMCKEESGAWGNWKLVLS